jgi:hypothetical protein
MTIPRDDITGHAIRKRANILGNLQAACEEVDPDADEINRFRPWYRVWLATNGYEVDEVRYTKIRRRRK